MLGMVERIARGMAIVGGLILTVLIVLVCVSVIGRGGNTFGHWDGLKDVFPGFADWLIGTGIGPVKGDFELVEAGVAFAIFSFLPLCQLRAGHATVDIFTSHLPRRVTGFLIAFWELVMTAIILLITWRLAAGLQDKIANGQITFILQVPVWWAYAASLIAACAASLVAVYCSVARVLQLLTGRRMMPDAEGAEH